MAAGDGIRLVCSGERAREEKRRDDRRRGRAMVVIRINKMHRVRWCPDLEGDTRPEDDNACQPG